MQGDRLRLGGRDVSLGFRVAGRVADVLGDGGTSVVVGQLLARLGAGRATGDTSQSALDAATTPRSYIVRNCLLSTGPLVGQVEGMQTGSARTFHTMRELWRAIASGTWSA